MTRPTRYTEKNSSRDWIDEFAATSTTEETRGAFRFTIGKYLRRYGKKDDPLQEALKIQDYANRLVEFEQAALLSTAMPADFGQQHAIEPAAAMDDDSPRMQAIAQNGNDGEAYSEIDRLRAAADFNDDVPVTIAEAIALGAVPQREPCKPRHRCQTCAGGHATHECGAHL